MSIFHRKTLDRVIITTTIQKLCAPLDDTCDDLSPPPPPLLPPPASENHTLSPLQVLMISSLISCFLFVCYITFIKIYSTFRNRSLARNTNTNTNANNNNNNNDNDRFNTNDETHNDHFTHDESSVVFHPIWLINTVGLDQSVIDSIEVFKYRKKHESDVKDCAICLGEFQDDETLRILPKCCHVFHVTCIDTWLRSHVNCPVCRAPIVDNNNNNNNDNDNTSISIDNQVDQDPTHSNTNDEEIVIPVDDDLGNDVIRDENEQKDEKKYLCNGVRGQSDLRDYYCCDQRIEPMRRSVSMDSFSGSLELEVLRKTNGWR
ncbi:uncharacterized protein [Rutidosis leptorrhynchoides]|uniref:uncharacterized protein n=1 Tax=Rutidosis leptorrhynchoides TaxID=125765 RepID=UPI003A99B1DE